MSNDLFASTPRPITASSVPDLLARLGGALYGPGRWQLKVAEALGVYDRTVRRWVAGDCVPSPATISGLRREIRRRRAEIDRADELLDTLLTKLEGKAS